MITKLAASIYFQVWQVQDGSSTMCVLSQEIVCGYPVPSVWRTEYSVLVVVVSGTSALLLCSLYCIQRSV